MTPIETSAQDSETNNTALAEAKAAAMRRLGVAMPLIDTPPRPDTPEVQARARSAAGNAMMLVVSGLYGAPSAVDMKDPNSVAKFMEMNQNIGVATKRFGSQPQEFTGEFAPALEAAASSLRAAIDEQLSPDELLNVARLDASLEPADSYAGPAVYFAATAYKAIWEREAREEAASTQWAETSP